MRAITEWVGKTDDTVVPPRVRLRVFERHGGRCYLTGRRIGPGDKWELDHIKALCNGGCHIESNLAPVLVAEHRKKTAKDVGEKSKVRRTRMKHLGLWPQSKRKIRSRGFQRRAQ